MVLVLVKSVSSFGIGLVEVVVCLGKVVQKASLQPLTIVVEMKSCYDLVCLVICGRRDQTLMLMMEGDMRFADFEVSKAFRVGIESYLFICF